MPSYDPSLFNVNPYYDDFSEDKKFLRMLFRPGYSVQSRELTQLQTILQNQIERFGNHVFKDGSRVIGGEISTQTLDYVRINRDTYAAPFFAITAEDIVGYNLIQRTTNGDIQVKAKVIDYKEPISGSDPHGIAVISYLSGSAFSAGVTLECDNQDKLVQISIPGVGSLSPGMSHTNKCKVVGVNDGIYYLNGFFVKSSAQFEPAYTINPQTGVRDFTTPSGWMGYDVVSTIITEKEDYTIKDPASGSYNYNAPGSHRYKLDLVLKFVETLSNEDFIELVKYESGVIVKKNEDTQYSELLKLFAQRTYDESGNYIARPFELSMRNGAGNTHYVDIGSGKAYVYGYEYETKFKETVDVSKARSTKDFDNQNISNYFGNYIEGRVDSTSNNVALFTTLNQSLGQYSRGHRVYINRSPILGQGTSAPDLRNARLTGYLGKIEPSQNISKISSQQSDGITFVANLLDVDYVNRTPAGYTNASNASLEFFQVLYHYDENLKISTPLMKLNGTEIFGMTLSVQTGSSGSTYTVFPSYFKSENPESKTLVFQVNGANPSTLVKNIDDLQYVHTASVGFQKSSTSQVEVYLNLGTDFNWCSGNGVVPNGSSVQLNITDGYYLVCTTGNTSAGIPTGTVLRVVSNETSVPAGILKITGIISSDGDRILLSNNLPLGGYYLVGKAKHNSSNLILQPDQELVGRMRVKGSTAASETITNTSQNLDTFKRIVKYNTSNVPYEMYFVLTRPDVWKINSIVDAANVDVSDRFVFDDGQTDTRYELSKLYVKPEYFSTYGPNSTFTFTVNYSYFTHSGYGPFTVESYRGISYENIPIFTSQRSGKSIHLANAIDFRFIAAIEGSTSNQYVSYSNGILPDRLTLNTSHRDYLPRIDKLVVDSNISSDGDSPALRHIVGVPSESPVIPEDVANSMTISVLSIPAYTFKANDIKAEGINNKRFTMKDIGDISKRLGDLEQYAVLNELELGIVSKNLKLNNGNDAIKKAIIVDTFDGHSIADVSNIDHQCSIDIERGELRPAFKSDSYEFVYVGNDPGLTLTPDNILCHNYTKFPTAVISQEKASGTVVVNQFGLPNWVGNMSITPHGDYWYDNTTRAVVKTNKEGSNDAWEVSNMLGYLGHGSQWNDWESIWSGISVELDDAENQRNTSFFSKARNGQPTSLVNKKSVVVTGTERFISSIETTKENYIAKLRKKEFYDEITANTLINKSVVPIMRGNKNITINAYNLKPNTQVHVFFDNINVNQYCSINGVTGPFTTDVNNGSLLNMIFDVPSNMFEVGEKIIRIVDEANNVIDDATTIAEIVYDVSGIPKESDIVVSGIRPTEIRKQTPNSSKIVSNPLFRDKSINTAKYNQWLDPMAQTFEISQNYYPNGLYLDSVDLFFATKDSSLPVTIEIHPVVGALPHPSVVLPFSTVVHNPSAVNANSNIPTATNFKFRTPVYLAPGNYALMVRCNSSKYSLFSANIGEFDIITNERISSTFSGGVLFRPQNSSEPNGDSNIDLMFKLNRCQFSSPSADIILQNYYSGSQDNNIVHLMQPNPYIFAPQGVSISTKVALGATELSVVPFRNRKLDNPYQITGQGMLNFKFITTSVTPTLLTPMVDLNKTNIIVVENVIDTSNSSTEESTPISGIPNPTVARYISKNVTMPIGETAKEMKVIFDLNIPKDTFVSVYGKVSDSRKNSGYDSMDKYVLMTVDGDNPFLVGNQVTNSLTPFDFREISYKMVPDVEFDSFSVKLCMYSSNPCNTPVIKNLRVVAVE